MHTVSTHALALVSVAGIDMAKVCPDCWCELTRNNKGQPAPAVLKNSLVCVDTGKVPTHLLPLTAVEAKLLAPYRYSRDMFLMKPKGRQNRPNEAYQRAWTGHVLAYPQAAGHRLGAAFPANPEEAAAAINIMFLHPAREEADIAAMASRSPALQVGGHCCGS